MLDWITVKPGDWEKVKAVMGTIVGVPVSVIACSLLIGSLWYHWKGLCSFFDYPTHRNEITVRCEQVERAKRKGMFSDYNSIRFNSGVYSTELSFYSKNLSGICDYELTSSDLGKVTEEISKLHSAKNIQLEGLLTTCDNNRNTFKPEKAYVDGIEYKCKQR